MNWLYWAAAISVADVMIVVFNYGAHRKKTDRESRRMRARDGVEGFGTTLRIICKLF